MGLEAARLLYEYFPDFYAASGLDRELITGPLMLGCVAALGQLTEQRGIVLRWPGEYGGFYEQGLTRYELAPTPLETLRMYDGVSEGFLYELHSFVWAPQPMYYGWGVQSLLDGEGDTEGDLLTVTLWHLLGRTPMSLGVKLHDVLKEIGGVDEDDIFDICRIKQLPAAVPLRLLGANLTLDVADRHGVKTLDLLAYPIGKTSNPLANYTDYEVEAIYMGEMEEEFDWDSLDRLVDYSAHGKRLAEAYGEWESQVRTLADVRKLAGQLHKAARAAEKELQEPPKTLMTLLCDPDGELPELRGRGQLDAYAEAIAAMETM